jgi:hypothetical protein
MLKLLDKIMKFLFPEESLISEEGYDILNNPKKKEILNRLIDNYRETGIWDEKLIEQINSI